MLARLSKIFKRSDSPNRKGLNSEISPQREMGAKALNTWSLWLEPDELTNSALQHTIKSLSSISPVSPIFAPHATLCGSVSISLDVASIRSTLERIIAEVQQHQPLALACRSATTGEIHFQCILLPIEPSTELMTLRNTVAEAFGEKKSYYPHISLKYGDIDIKRKEEIAGEVRNAPASDVVIVKGISIVRCVGTADDWEVVDFVPFK